MAFHINSNIRKRVYADETLQGGAGLGNLLKGIQKKMRRQPDDEFADEDDEDFSNPSIPTLREGFNNQPEESSAVNSIPNQATGGHTVIPEDSVEITDLTDPAVQERLKAEQERQNGEALALDKDFNESLRPFLKPESQSVQYLYRYHEGDTPPPVGRRYFGYQQEKRRGRVKKLNAYFNDATIWTAQTKRGAEYFAHEQANSNHNAVNKENEKREERNQVRLEDIAKALRLKTPRGNEKAQKLQSEMEELLEPVYTSTGFILKLRVPPGQKQIPVAKHLKKLSRKTEQQQDTSFYDPLVHHNHEVYDIHNASQERFDSTKQHLSNYGKYVRNKEVAVDAGKEAIPMSGVVVESVEPYTAHILSPEVQRYTAGRDLLQWHGRLH